MQDLGQIVKVTSPDFQISMRVIRKKQSVKIGLPLSRLQIVDFQQIFAFKLGTLFTIKYIQL